MMIDPTDSKRALRALARHSRPAGEVEALCRQVLAFPVPRHSVVAGVWPLPGEPDLVPAWTAMHRAGHALLMPETTASGTPLRFHHWRPGDPMLPGRFGTAHPAGGEATPGVVFVPLLAWDLTLNRLGYGGGYYDRTLAALPGALRIGFGFEAQRIDRVPTGPHDITLDAIVTETRIVHAKDRRR